jgi:hypothetical protein
VIELVVSGGQTGADQAGWRAAKAAGIKTGGCMPRGFWAEDGNHPEFAEMYGAQEVQECGKRLSPAEALRLRTWLNVRDAEATILFGNSESPGGKLTAKYCKEMDRKIWRVPRSSLWIPDAIHSMRAGGNIQTLNIAGNRESSAPGIGAWVEDYLAEVFRQVKEAPR